MPVYNKTIEYFTCKFKCGEKARPLSTMEKHEAKCFCNPETRSCRICKNYSTGTESVACRIYGLSISNDAKYLVYDKDGNKVWDWYEEQLNEKNDMLFYQPKERPFPKSNCMQFELGKKAY